MSTVIKCLDKFEYILDAGCFPKKCDSLFIECLRFLEYILFLGEEEQVALLGDLLSLTYILSSTTLINIFHFTSSICEWRIVATALIMSSTLGFSRVEPIKIELIVDDFLSSIIFPFLTN